jgi:NAD+ synthase (glutamine-hydrolysing)
MGMTYDDLGVYGRLRKMARCGPVAMYRRCLSLWRDTMTPAAAAEKARLEEAGPGCWPGAA